jgi:hypothetical protein
MTIELEEKEKEWSFGRDSYVINLGEGSARRPLSFSRDGGGVILTGFLDGDRLTLIHILGLVLWLKQCGDI